MKRVCKTSDDDRITNLPVDVIHRILVVLPIKDAAKASILSAKWREHWRGIPQLVFDDSFTTGEGGESDPTEKMHKLLLTIHKVLLLHDGPITKFVLYAPRLRSCYPNEIDQIILSLSDRGLQEFSFICSDEQTYKLHSALFSCLHLRSLRLWDCEFRQPSWFLGFSKLTDLQLGEVVLPSDFFDKFLPNCPMLKILMVLHCPGTPSNVEIVTPCLEEFYFTGDFQKIRFKCTPLLKTVCIFKKHGKVDKPPDMVALFASLPALQRFHVNFDLLEYLAGSDSNLPIRLPSPLHHLKLLHIYRLDLGSLRNVRAFACLIMSSPNLFEIELSIKPAANDATPSIGTLLETEHYRGSGCCLQSLEVFEIKGIHGIQIELDLVRFILATAPSLGRVYITPVDKLEAKKVSEFMKEVMQCKRVSKEAKIVYAGTYED